MPYRNGKIVNWRIKVKGIKSLLTEDTSDEYAQKIGTTIYNILNQRVYDKYFEDFDNQIGFEIDEFKWVRKTNELNDLLASLYDYCDAELILIN